MPSPRVSVCIDVHNYADFLPQAIESALAQTFRDLEIIIVDDCSTDSSFAVACRYAQQDSRIRAHRNPVNLGMVKNRNACLKLATGEYVKFIHADDYLCSPDAVSRMVARLDANPAASLVACAMQFVPAPPGAKDRSPKYFSAARFLAGTTVITRCLAEQRNLIGGPSAVLFRRSRAARGFDERYFHAADLEMWFHLLEQGCFGYVDEPLVAYRWHARQQTEKDRGTLTQANDQRTLLATYLEKPYVRLRSWMKKFLVHAAVRQTLRRCRQLGQRAAAAEVLREYGGAARYYANQPQFALWKLALKCSRRLYDRALPYYAVQAPAAAPPSLPVGINVAGFFNGQFGIGESSRAFCQAVADSEFPSMLVNIQSRVHNNSDTKVASASGKNPYGVNLMTFSFDYSRRFFLDQGPRFFAGRYNIALWYWELEHFPARWHSNFDYYDEIWVPTDFCQRALAAVSPVPVHKITYPFHAGAMPEKKLPRAGRAGFSLRESACVFLFNFDFCSEVARKNPLAVIAAFRQAFSPAEDVTLVLKSINSHFDSAGHAQIRQAVAGLKVVWLEAHLSHEQMAALFATADCYVSLHRSEGLGLGMAQAMALGKPVIATGYSGNLDFMRPGSSLLVDYELVEIKETSGPYERGNFWAEPDVADAAKKMRWVYDHRDESERLGERGAVEIRTALAPEKTRREIQDRLREIYQGRTI